MPQDPQKPPPPRRHPPRGRRSRVHHLPLLFQPPDGRVQPHQRPRQNPLRRPLRHLHRQEFRHRHHRRLHRLRRLRIPPQETLAREQIVILSSSTRSDERRRRTCHFPSASPPHSSVARPNSASAPPDPPGKSSPRHPAPPQSPPPSTTESPSSSRSPPPSPRAARLVRPAPRRKHKVHVVPHLSLVLELVGLGIYRPQLPTPAPVPRATPAPQPARGSSPASISPPGVSQNTNSPSVRITTHRISNTRPAGSNTITRADRRVLTYSDLLGTRTSPMLQHIPPAPSKRCLCKMSRPFRPRTSNDNDEHYQAYPGSQPD